MELLNVFLVVLAALGSTVAQLDSSGETPDYQDFDLALATMQTSSDRTAEVAEQALDEISDIVNSLTLATGEARFSIMHVSNFDTGNDLPALAAMVPAGMSDACVTADKGAIKEITVSTGLGMVECFTDKVNAAQDILKDTLALENQGAAIMPKAITAIENCRQNGDPACFESEVKKTLEGFVTIQHELAQNVARAKGLLDTLQSDLEVCLGQLLANFITEVGKYGVTMVSCFVNGV